MLRRKVLRLATALGFVISSVAVAQDATTPPPAAPPPAAPPAAAPQSTVVGDQPAAAPAAKDDQEKTEEIVVTGTRIRRKDLSTPAPVTVLSSEQLTSSGKVSIGDFLQTLPEQGGAINTQVNNGGDGTTEVALRNLTSARTLVLVNGRRMVAGGTSAGATVDLNSIPTAAVERVEILKDGASAVYGSDAIAGVVNIITKKKMNGTEASAYAGTTSHNDGTIYDLALTTGTASEKGNLLFSAGFTKVGTIWAGDRDWAAKALIYDYTTGEISNGGSSAIAQGRFGLPPYVDNPVDQGVCLASSVAGGACTSITGTQGSLAALLLQSRLKTPTSDPLLSASYNSRNFMYDPTRPGAIQGYAPYSGANAYNYQAVNYLVTPSQRVQLFSTGDANLGDIARAYFEASYVERTSRTQIAPDPLFTVNYDLSVSKDSIYNPTGVDLPDVRRRLLEFGARADDYNVTTFRTVLGLDGTIPDSVPFVKGWYWDANFNWGRTSGTDTNSGALRNPYVAAAIGPSMIDNRAGEPTFGKPICVATPNDPASMIAGCVPLNLLHAGGGVPDAAQAAALGFTGTNRALNQMQQFAANVTGEIFRLADRPISLALGADYTDYTASLVVNTINLAGEGDNYNASNVAGSYNTTQGYAELQIPIASNMVGLQELEVDLAAREAHYSTFGNKATYKAGVRYSPIRDVTLRGTFSTAYRAPSITNLYSGASESFPSVSDPCADLSAATPAMKDRCVANGVAPALRDVGTNDQNTQLKEFIGGNPKIQPETAKIFTVGVVFQPQMVRNLAATVDYFNTKIENTIGTIGAANILSGCFGQDYQPYCQAIHRDASTSQIIGIDDLITNYSKLDVQGIDLGLTYALPTPVGKFGLSFNGSYLIEFKQNLPSGQVIDARGNYDFNQTANPVFKALGGLSYGIGGLGVGWTTRYIHSFKECSNNNPASDNFGTGTNGLCYTNDAAFTGPTLNWPNVIERTVSAYFLHDLVLRYGLKSRAGLTSIALGVQNVFDARPPRVFDSFISYADYDYQFAGRSFYARLQQNF